MGLPQTCTTSIFALSLAACGGATDNAADPRRNVPGEVPDAAGVDVARSTLGPDASSSSDPGLPAGPGPLVDAAIASPPDAPTVAAACARGTWCWEDPLPQGEALGSVLLASATDGWVGGAHGALLRLGAGGWALQPSPTDLGISSLISAGPSDVWGIGTSEDDASSASTAMGGLLHWDGSSWTLMRPGARYYSSLGATAPDNVWALTWNPSGPTLLFWNGVAWAKATPPPSQYTLGALCVRGVDDVWATAAVQGTSDDTSILHWDGSTWSESNVLGSYSQRFADGIACASGSDVWATVFDFGAQGSWEACWHEGSWSQVDLPAQLASDDARELRFASDGSFVVIDRGGPSVVARWASDAWQTISPAAPPPLTAIPMGDLDFAPDGTGWLTSGSDLAPWRSGAWDTSSVVPRDTVQAFTGSPGAPPTYGLGQEGSLFARSTPAASWSIVRPEQPGGFDLTASWSANGSDVWIAAGASVTHLVDGTMTPFTLGTGTYVASFSGTSSNDVWALDVEGAIYTWDGTAWSTFAHPIPGTLDATDAPVGFASLFVRADDDAWAVGGSESQYQRRPAAFHWDGTAWTGEWLGPDGLGEASSVLGTGATDVWVSGPQLWHRGADATWNVVAAAGAPGSLHATASGLYWLGTANDALAVQRLDLASMAIASWNVPVDAELSIDALWVGARTPGAEDSLWVGGQNGAVLSFSP